MGLTKVSEALLGWSRFETFLLVIPIILVYVVLSGYMGVVMSDLIQTAIMIVSSLVLMGLVWARLRRADRALSGVGDAVWGRSG